MKQYLCETLKVDTQDPKYYYVELLLKRVVKPQVVTCACRID